MAQRASVPQYAGTAEQAKEAVEGLVMDIEVYTIYCRNYTYPIMMLFSMDTYVV